MEIEKAIRDFLAKNVLYDENGFTLGDDTSFLETAVLDSMAVVELVSWMEAKFAFKADIRDITPDNFDSVNRLANYIRRSLGNGLREASVSAVGVSPR